MKYSQATLGRVFVVRLEDGDILHEQLEALALREGVRSAAVLVVGGADLGSRLITGPEDGRAAVINPMQTVLDNVHEAAGTGTIFPDDNGKPVLHLHMACGREDQTVTGCVRAGVKIWQVMEAVVIELTGCTAQRLLDPVTGFKLLQP